MLRRDGEDVLLGPVYGPDRCDLGFVEDLLRVQLAGPALRLDDPAPRGAGRPAELIELVGLQRPTGGVTAEASAQGERRVLVGEQERVAVDPRGPAQVADHEVAHAVGPLAVKITANQAIMMTTPAADPHEDRTKTCGMTMK